MRFFEIFDDDVDAVAVVADVDHVDDNGNVTFTFLSSNYVENCLCPKWLLRESVLESVCP